MRIGIILLFILSFSFVCKSQEWKRGANWILGYSPPCLFNFTKSELEVDTLTKTGPSLTNGASCVSDSSGNLQFFCNGFHVYNHEGWPLKWDNGTTDTLNNALGNKLYDYYNGDGLWHQMSLILPKKNNQYYVFTCGMSDGAFDDWKVTQTDFRFDVLTYHVVDMDAQGGQGEVVAKNKILMQDAYLSHNRMSAVRHANGRDWWLVKPHRNEQIFYLFLVQPDDILGPYTRQVNFNIDSIPIQWGSYGIRGQLSFSANGEWMGSTEAGYGGVFVYRFDRCNGTLTPYHFFKQPWMDSTLEDFSIAHCFSPNNQLLYLINGANIWQYDLADTTANSAIHISGPDTVLGYFPMYSLSYLAPNDKIYIGAFHGIRKPCLL
ncbi:MAG: hypothetical protein HWD58_11105 [Bacteroidota bacterium]|nr:MAG: hypothetical protein HWD58_11105 [Bacteroidota bacterium]